MTRVALVTGAATGIGRAIATELGRDHDIAFTWRQTEPGALQADLPGALAVQADLSRPEAARHVIAEVIRRFGRLDLIVNNAGALHMTPHDRFDAAAHMAAYTVNVIAPAALLAAALPHLREGAAIVSISSVNAVLPPRGAAAYAGSKAALNLWTRGMAKELGPKGIRVNAVAPGAVERPEQRRPDSLVAAFVKDTALGRLASPADIAAAVRFLGSDAAAAITGVVLDVSGGYRL